jgi:hypothetical protein
VNKCKSSEKIATTGKNQSKPVTLEEKLDVIKRYEHNEYMADTMNATGIPKQTLRTIWKQGEKINESCIKVQ